MYSLKLLNVLLISVSYFACAHFKWHLVYYGVESWSEAMEWCIMSPPFRVGRHIVFPWASACLSVTNRVRSIT